MINYAVVGAGWISQQAFLPGVVQSGNSRVAAIVTGDRAKAARLADFYGIGIVVGYDGYDALLASPAIDAVYIALPITPFGRHAPASMSWSRSRSR
jgi:predicted dehydrogenase